MQQKKGKIAVSNQELNKLVDASEGNSNAARYYKQNRIAFYYMIFTIARLGLKAELGIPFQDEDIMSGTVSGEKIDDMYDPAMAQENKLGGLYANRNCTGYNPSNKSNQQPDPQRKHEDLFDPEFQEDTTQNEDYDE